MAETDSTDSRGVTNTSVQPSSMSEFGERRSFRAHLGVVLAAWLLSLGIDFFLHAGALAKLYLSESPFLLSAELAFARIPLGYVSFLILTAALWWFCNTLGVRGAAAGLRLGLVSGAAVWGGILIGLFSISTAPADLLLGWWVGQSLELGAAGAVIGAGLASDRRSAIYVRVALAMLICIAATIGLQLLGWAPAMESVGTP